MSSSRNVPLNLLAVAVLGLFLWWAENSLTGYQVQIINLIAINTILALGLNLIYGFGGMFSLGHAGFMAIGAYTCALLILPPLQKQMIFILQPLRWPFSVMHAPFLVAVLLGGLVAAIFSILVGIPILRLGGDYLGIATLGFAEIVRVVANNIPSVTNGALGLKGIPPYANIWWNYGFLIIILYSMIKLINSNYGNVLKAIRDDEIAAKAMGIDVFKYKIQAFAMGSFLAGLGGALQASFITTIDPKMYMFTLTFNVLMMVVAGGLGSITGTCIASALITVLLEWLRIVENPLDLGPIHIPGIPGMRMVIFSLALIFIILFRREGIMGMREITWDGIIGFLGRAKRHAE
ncbi:MAG TPA: branched-chain amino acid ABC transporter permease [Acetomicrobium flavidum]|uniref:Amino acid/amide ABC transporter membrane protein 2, HAAT family n=2 Tax=Acetomicrobium TaxID=49894 RepID=I4BUR0_ACEMN|nr:branched-chain amino acid ABC transporter permease [Acetomicrobium mobile]SIN65349.1 amino acid/amide ABC transporter membrane protein 2, HAAT family [Acetomicrobium flavidum]AFM21017.1 amino acid/amide ABC transporter membrane protein 2, HAAT family [Acetomicrobium mobile DSM 13181]HOJ81495.1 branched-chain amino acid ABC transporter permease [Acetomicrobium flavidum]HOM30477.1 branched-chain amino acid ABC transporter permease [Acetomicrobium flavidum]HOP87738.1 branched-chain amino acid 